MEKKRNNEKAKIELLKIAKPSCKKCHGTGYIGIHASGKLAICQCAFKKLERFKIAKLIKKGEAEV